MSRAYLLVSTNPRGRRRLAKAKDAARGRDCARCGYGPVDGRKRCPACYGPTGPGVSPPSATSGETWRSRDVGHAPAPVSSPADGPVQGILP